MKLRLALTALVAFSGCRSRSAAAPDGAALPEGAVARLGAAGLRHPGLAAVSASSAFVATHARASGVRVWDPAGGRLLRSVETRGEVAFSPDGGFVASESSRLFASTVDVHELAGGGRIAEIDDGKDVRLLALSAGGARLAVAHRDGVIRVHDTAKKTILFEIKRGDASAMGFTPGEPVLTLVTEGAVELISAAGEPMRTLELGGVKARHLAFSGDGRRGATADQRGGVHVFDVESGRVLAVFSPAGDTEPPPAIALSFDGKAGVVSTADDRVLLFDAEQGRLRAELYASDEDTTALAFAPDGTIHAGTEGGALRRWRADGTELHDGRAGFFSAIEVIAFHPKKDELAIAGGSPAVHLFEVGSGRSTARAAETRRARAAAYSPDGALLATGGKDEHLHVWEGEAERARYFAHEGGVRVLTFSPSGDRLLSGGQDGLVVIYRGAGESVERTFGEHAALEAITAAAWSPDGALVVAGDSNGRIRLWHAATGAALGVIDVDRAFSVTSISFSAGGAHLAATASDRLALWDMKSGAPVLSLKTDAWSISRASFSPDGARIAFGDSKGNLWIADVAGGRILARVSSGDAGVSTVAWSPDGERIYAGGRDTTVLVFDAGHEVFARPPTEEDLELVSISTAPLDEEDPLERLPALVPARPACVDAPGADRSGDALPACAIQRAGTMRLRSPGDVGRLAWSPDGRLIAAGRDQQEHVDVWDAASGRRVFVLPVSDIGASVLRFSPRSDHLAVADVLRRVIRVFDTKTGRKTGKLAGLNASTMAWSPAGDRLAAAGARGGLMIWDVARGAVIASGTHEAREGAELLFTEGNQVELRDGSGVAAVFDARTLEPLAPRELEGEVSPLDRDDALLVKLGFERRVPIARSPDGRSAAVALDNAVEVRALQPGGRTLALAGHTGWVTAVRLTGDVVWTWDGAAARAWDVKTGAERRAYPGTGRAAWSRDGRRMAIAGERAIHLYESGARVGSVAIEGLSYAPELELSPDGELLAAVDMTEPAGVIVWRVKTKRRERRIVTGFELGGSQLAFAPDGRLAIASEAIVQVRAANGTLQHTLEAGEEEVTDLAFSPDGAVLAAAGRDHLIRLWSREGEPVGVLEGHTSVVSAVDFCDDGTLVSGGWDDTVRLWDVTAASGRGVFTGHEQLVTSVSCGPGSRHVASGSWDATALVWDRARLAGP